MKRAFDIGLAFVGLVILLPFFAVIAVLIRLDSTGPVLFRQERIGMGLRPFSILKFRTMVQDAERRGGLITYGDDPRITRMGKVLRATKIDELPQLLNVLLGDMSFVGPRPEVRKYVDLYRADYEEILKVRPGITDLASLKYQDESKLMAQFSNPEEVYVRRILPDKICLAKEYIKRSSFLFDLGLVLQTLPKLFGVSRPPGMIDRRRVTAPTAKGKPPSANREP